MENISLGLILALSCYFVISIVWGLMITTRFFDDADFNVGRFFSLAKVWEAIFTSIFLPSVFVALGFLIFCGVLAVVIAPFVFLGVWISDKRKMKEPKPKRPQTKLEKFFNKKLFV